MCGAGWCSQTFPGGAPKPFLGDAPRPFPSDAPKSLPGDAPKPFPINAPKSLPSTIPKPFPSDAPSPAAMLSASSRAMLPILSHSLLPKTSPQFHHGAPRPGRGGLSPPPRSPRQSRESGTRKSLALLRFSPALRAPKALGGWFRRSLSFRHRKFSLCSTPLLVGLSRFHPRYRKGCVARPRFPPSPIIFICF